MGGAAYTKWDGPIPGSEDTFDGGFAVTLTPVTGTGSLRADKYVLQGPEEVTFTATISPLSVGGYTVPHSIAWRWVPDQPGGWNPAQNCGPWLVCTTTVSASGTMFADFVINGESSSKSVRIVVNNCPPTGHPWVDNPDLRGHLEQDLLNSNPSGPDQGRHEVPGSWYGSSATGEMSYHPITPSSADNCSNSASFPVIPDSTLQVITHTHPYPPYTLLGWCGEDSIPPGFGYTEGPSSDDSVTVNGVSAQHGHAVEMCIIDVGTIYCLPPGTPINGRKKFVKQANGCYIQKP